MNRILKYSFLIGLAFIRLYSFGQNQKINWYFGQNAGLSFITNPPTLLTNGALNTPEGCATISDAAGSLLFYTNGVTVWDQSHSTMANGTGLQGNTSSVQSSLIVKKPGSNNLYYLFTLDGALGFKYSIIDMTLAAGMGSVTVKNSPLYTGSCTEKMTGTRHCNGVDSWIVIHENGTLNYRSYLLTAAGISTTAVVSNVGANGHYFGSMKISPNGKKITNVAYNLAYPELCDFDNSTGIVSNPITLMNSSGSYGCEYSPDGTKLYTAIVGGLPQVCQWDLCAGSSAAIIASLYTFTATGGFGMQLAPNGKIYISKVSSQLSVINSPNLAGAAANYVDLGYSLSPKSSYLGICNFINNPQPSPPFTYTASNVFGCHAAAFASPYTPTTQIGCIASGYSLNALQWNFGDPSSGFANTSTLANPIHLFSSNGNYTVQLIYFYSCGGGTDTVRQVVSINQNCISLNTASISCANLGSATVSAIAGMGPYSYTWMPSAQTGSVASGLTPGTYTISFYDFGYNTTYTDVIQLNPVVPFTGSLSATNSLTCFGASNGTAGISNISGGSGTQTYLWTNGTSSHSTAFTASLGAGTWSLSVTDTQTGCQINQTFLITQPPALTFTLATSSPSACAGNIILLGATTSGGTPFTTGPAYSYSWSGGPVTNTCSVTQLSGGSYIYTLSSSDSNNCVITDTIAVTFIPNPVLTVANASICPLTVATLTALGANSYTWTSASLTLTGASFTASPLVSTQYTVSGTAMGCSSIIYPSVYIYPLPLPGLSSNSPRCTGQSLQMVGSGGTSYFWSGPQSFQSNLPSPLINGTSVLNSGLYSLTVTSVNGCTASISQSLTVNPTPTLSASNIAICTSQTLNLNVSSSPGLNYQWGGPLGFLSNQQNPSISNPGLIHSGIYSVSATSLLNCAKTVTVQVTVISPPSLFVSLSGNGTLCAQALNGSPNSITLTSGGATTYTLETPSYILNNNPSGPSSPLSTLPPHPSGISTATLTGSNGVCSSSTTISFSVISNPILSISSTTPVICAGKSYTYTNSGASSYTWGPGTPGLNTYTGPVTVASPTITSVYSVVGGSLGCNSGTQTSTITVNPIPIVSISPHDPAICLGDRINLTANGTGTSYTWSPNIAINSGTGAIVSVWPSVQQSYSVLASLNTCTQLAKVTVSILPLPSPEIVLSKATICRTESITMTGKGGINYEWTGPNNLLYTGKTISFTATSMAYAGTYKLLVIDSNDCKNTGSAVLAMNDLPNGYLIGSNKINCIPFLSEFNFHSNASSTFQWTLKDASYSGKTFTHYFTEAGDQIISGYLKDTLTSCVNTLSFIVKAYPVPKANFSFEPENPVENLESVHFTNQSSGEEQSKWHWFFNDNKGYKANTTNTSYLFQDAGLYPIAFIVENKYGCSDTIIKTIRVETDLSIYVPNVFSPNADELNDIFLPVVRGQKFYQLRVFNRWGDLIFESIDPQVGWDGNYRGESCKTDVYIWKISVSGKNGEHKDLKGEVILSR